MTRYVYSLGVEVEYALGEEVAPPIQPPPPPTTGETAGAATGEHLNGYRVVVADLNGVPLEELEVKNLQYSFNLNSPGSCNFVVLRRDAKIAASTGLMQPGKREIHVYRNDTRVWGGYLWGAVASTGEPTVRFACEGWLSIFRYRYIKNTQAYTAQEQFAIAWDIIEQAQALTGGDYGIQRYDFEVPSGVTRTRTYYGHEKKNIYEALTELAAVNQGFDFDIDPYKVWRVYYPRKGSRIGTRFEYGKNIKTFYTQDDATKTRSEITAFGEGDGTTKKQSIQQDATALAEFGLRQDTVTFNDVRNQSTLDAHALEELRQVKELYSNMGLVMETEDPGFGEYVEGDEAHVIIEDGYISVDRWLRITSRNIQLSDEGHEVIQLSFDEALGI